jgi:hypothetical protein
MTQKAEEQPVQPPPQGRRGLGGWTGFGNKTLWDWLQLLVVPVMLAIVGFLLAAAQQNIQQQAEEQRAQDEGLRSYFDSIGQQISDKTLQPENPDQEAQAQARARTLALLERLDPHRKKSVQWGNRCSQSLWC